MEMKMKKLLCVMIAVLCVGAFASCGNSKGDSSGGTSKGASASADDNSTDGKWVLSEVGQGNGNVLTADEIEGTRMYEFEGTSGKYTVDNPVKNETRMVTLQKDGDTYTILDDILEIKGVTFKGGKMSYTDEMNMTYVFTKQ